jgi:hypothetical protein
MKIRLAETSLGTSSIFGSSKLKAQATSAKMFRVRNSAVKRRVGALD